MSEVSGIVYVPDSPDPILPQAIQKQVNYANALIDWQQKALKHERWQKEWKAASWCNRALMILGVRRG